MPWSRVHSDVRETLNVWRLNVWASGLSILKTRLSITRHSTGCVRKLSVPDGTLVLRAAGTAEIVCLRVLIVCG